MLGSKIILTLTAILFSTSLRIYPYAGNPKIIQFYNELVKHNKLHMLDKKIPRDKLKYLNNRRLRIVRNCILARKGYVFKSKDLNEFFTEKKWYKPNKNFTNKNLSKTDLFNIELIKNLEFYNYNRVPVAIKKKVTNFEDIAAEVSIDKKSVVLNQLEPFSKFPAKHNEKLLKSIHFIDLNFDGKLDIVFYGKFSHSLHCFVYLNKDDKYQEVMMNISRLKYFWQENNTTYLILDARGGIEAKFSHHIIVSIDKDSRVKEEWRAYLGHNRFYTTFPDKYTIQERKVLTKRMYLFSQPMNDNDRYIYDNIAAVIEKGSVLFKLHTIYKNKKRWAFVLAYPNAGIITDSKTDKKKQNVDKNLDLDKTVFNSNVMFYGWIKE